jgi:peptidoglycan hydrolase-like protein with peptidoglycan-binding domain
VRRLGVFGVALGVGMALSAAPALASPQQAGVQIALRAVGLYAGQIDGIVGPETRAALEAAQTRADLPVTGRITARTRASLGPLGRPELGTRLIAPGDVGLDVSVVQFLLVRAGLYHGALDGVMNAKLEAAVRSFQQQASLPVDGLVGPETLARLTAAVRIAGAPAQQIYVVQPGDSLTSIAVHDGTTLARLARLNGLDPARVLPVAARILLPAPASTSAMPASPAVVQSQLDLWAGRLGVPDDLVRALAWMESGYQPDVVSSVGARGVMQVLPSTRDFVEEVLVGHALPHTLDGDIEVGVLYLRHLLSQFDGDTGLALGAWYQGEAAVRRFGLYSVTKPFVADVLALQGRM